MQILHLMKLIIFDYDGVIMDTFECSRKIYQDISEEFNLNIPDDSNYLRELIELDWRETLKKLNLTTPEQLKRDEEIFKAGLIKYSDIIKPYKNIPKILQKLSKKYILAIVTNNFKSELDYRLKKFNINNYFRVYFGGDEGQLKPHPELILKCLSELSIKPQDTAYVGDMDGDIAAAKAAKLGKIIAVTYGYHAPQRLSEADIIINKPEELLTIF